MLHARPTVTRAAIALAFCVLAASLIGVACGSRAPSGARTESAGISVSAAEARLKQVVLQPSDAGAQFTQDQALIQTNDELAKARPDTEKARQQYGDWGQVLQYNVQYSASVAPDLVFSGKIARVMNTASLFRTSEGASAALAFIRDLAAPTVANFLVNDAEGTKISDTQVVKDISFPAEGDESFGWRLTGKATFTNGFTVTFVADTVWVRAGRVNGNVTAVAFGQAPNREDLVGLVDQFVGRAETAE